MKSLFPAGFACILALSTSCSDSKSDSSPSPTTQVGTSGGKVTADGASVDVPAGALSKPVAISVAVSKVEVEPPTGYALAGKAIAFTPHGTKFSSPVTLTLPYDSTSSALVVLRLDDEKDKTWDVLDGGKFARGAATLDVSGFSIYAVAEATGEGQGAAGAGGGGAVEPTGTGGSGDLAGAGPTSEAGTGTGGAPDSAGGAPTTGGGDLVFACDRTDTDGNGLRICSDYFYPALVVQLTKGQITRSCPGPGNGVVLDACDTTGAVAGCRATDADGIPGVIVTNWFYTGSKDEIKNGKLCTEKGSAYVDPP